MTSTNSRKIFCFAIGRGGRPRYYRVINEKKIPIEVGDYMDAVKGLTQVANYGREDNGYVYTYYEFE